jgi:drug/metabolite transporter (DMT)-like permease
VAIFLAEPTRITISNFGLLVLFGVMQFGLGLLLLTLGSRLIPASKASLLGNLELPLAPLWVWIAFGEIPAQSTYLGGSVVIAALIIDFLADTARTRSRLG